MSFWHLVKKSNILDLRNPLSFWQDIFLLIFLDLFLPANKKEITYYFWVATGNIEVWAFLIETLFYLNTFFYACRPRRPQIIRRKRRWATARTPTDLFKSAHIKDEAWLKNKKRVFPEDFSRVYIREEPQLHIHSKEKRERAWAQEEVFKHLKPSSFKLIILSSLSLCASL